jgi:hypothetical protein
MFKTKPVGPYQAEQPCRTKAARAGPLPHKDRFEAPLEMQPQIGIIRNSHHLIPQGGRRKLFGIGHIKPALVESALRAEHWCAGCAHCRMPLLVDSSAGLAATGPEPLRPLSRNVDGECPSPKSARASAFGFFHNRSQCGRLTSCSILLSFIAEGHPVSLLPDIRRPMRGSVADCNVL